MALADPRLSRSARMLLRRASPTGDRLPMNLRLALLVVPVSAALLGCPTNIISSSQGSAGPGGGGEGSSAGSGGGGGGGLLGSDLPEVHVVCEDRVEYCSQSQCPHLTATSGYDENAHLVSYIETNGTGARVFALTRGYDSSGRRVRQDEERLEDAPHRRGASWVYDDSGRVTRVTHEGFYLDVTTMAPTTYETRFFYDDAGRPERFEDSEDGVLKEVTRLLRIEGEPLIIEEVRDTDLDGEAELQMRWTLAEGRWLIQFEQFQDEVLAAREIYTYVDQSKGQVSGRDADFGADGVADEKDEVLWDASGHVQHLGFDLDGDGAVDQTNDYLYDVEGRLIERRWKVSAAMGSQPVDATTTIVWNNGRINRVERGDSATHVLWDSWTFARGCSGNPPEHVAIAPAHAWAEELETLPFSVDATTWWGVPEVL
jgi:hypothetical protein